MKIFKKWKYQQVYFVGLPIDLSKIVKNWLNTNNKVKIIKIDTMKYDNPNPNDINDRGKFITFITYKTK